MRSGKLEFSSEIWEFGDEKWEAKIEKWESGKLTSHFSHGIWEVGNGTQMGIPIFKISSSGWKRTSHWWIKAVFDPTDPNAIETCTWSQCKCNWDVRMSLLRLLESSSFSHWASFMRASCESQGRRDSTGRGGGYLRPTWDSHLGWMEKQRRLMQCPNLQGYQMKSMNNGQARSIADQKTGLICILLQILVGNTSCLIMAIWSDWLLSLVISVY